MRRATIGVAAGAALAAAIFIAVGVAVVRTLMVPAPVETGAVPPPPPVDPMQVARRLSEAISFQTVNYGAGVREAERTMAVRNMFLWLERTYPYFHEDAPQEIFGDSVLYVWRGTDDNLPPVLIVSHLDVAPVAEGTENNWTHEPFGGEIADGFVWGRGAIDNKSSAIAIMEAGDRLAQSNFQPRRTIMFAFGEDQESGGAKGNGTIARTLAERGVRFAWVLDEGSPILTEPYPGVDRPIAFLSVAEKGLLKLELAAKGEDQQGALSRAVSNAVGHAFPSDLDDIQRTKLNVLAPYAPFGERVQLANLWLTSPLVAGTLAGDRASAGAARTTVTSAMAAGTPENTGSPNALAVLDVHLHPRDTAASALDQVRAAIGDDDIDIRTLTEIEPSRTADVNGAAYAHIARAIAETFVVPVAPELMPRTTDSRHYLDIADAVLRFRPLPMRPDDFARVRWTDERVAISDLGSAVGFYTWLIRNSN